MCCQMELFLLDVALKKSAKIYKQQKREAITFLFLALIQNIFLNTHLLHNPYSVCSIHAETVKTQMNNSNTHMG